MPCGSGSQGYHGLVLAMTIGISSENCYAHTLVGRHSDEWEPLADYLDKVAESASTLNDLGRRIGST
jgi:hypothetical protein